uniref:Putative phosphatidylinositol transfer protein sec14 n=1 Tax=Panstrongylus lignarius TaxID=156445 RepID=A0A224XSQ8_9HEMI
MLLEELTEEEKAVVLAEVGYTRRQLDSDLEHIKDWLKLQHHLPPSRLTESDSFLKMYLTGCKGSLEKAKRKIDAYYSLRSCSEIFDCRNPLDSNYVNLMNLIYYAPSPKTASNQRFMFFRLADVDQEKFDSLSLMRNALNIAELVLRYENISMRFSLLYDTKGVTIGNHLAKISPLQIKDFIYYAFNALPYRYGNIYIINAPEYFVVTLNTLILPLLTKKLKSKIHVTANGFEEVSQYFDKSVVPRDYGGDLPPLKELHDFWRGLEIERKDWYMNEVSERCEESKRIIPEDPTNPFFGVPGSLKKLVVD